MPRNTTVRRSYTQEHQQEVLVKDAAEAPIYNSDKQSA